MRALTSCKDVRRCIVLFERRLLSEKDLYTCLRGMRSFMLLHLRGTFSYLEVLQDRLRVKILLKEDLNNVNVL